MDVRSSIFFFMKVLLISMFSSTKASRVMLREVGEERSGAMWEGRRKEDPEMRRQVR